ncbi:MAG: Ca-activated chloride channel [Pseudomonadota bacterium]|nr:Ca-activated chloride channel [Pseudomonadota bacterium]
MSRTKQQSCVLQAVQVKGRLQGLLGEMTIAQTYQNAESVNIEAVFTFPVPVEAVLLGVEICINDRQLQGRVLPKRQAEETYEDAVSGGDSAVLVQEAGRGLYTVNIGNLLSGETARLTYRYALLHVWNGHTLRFHLPQTIAPRYGNPLADGLQPHQIPQVALDAENRFSLELDLGGSLRQAVVDSPSHRISVAAEMEALHISLADQQALMDRDFILNIRGSAEARAAFGLYAPDGDGGVALASFQPDLAGQTDQGGRTCVLMADCSGSMAGDSIAQTREALLAILDRLQPADRFNVIAFGSQPQAFFKTLRSADIEGLAQACARAGGLEADLGGTEIGAALQLAYRQRPQGEPLDILLITDGEVWNVEKLVTEAKASGCRIFTVGVGASVAEGLVRGLAEATGGAAELVHPNEDMAGRIVRHFQRIRAPRAEASVNWPVEPKRQLPKMIRQVFSGDTLHLLAWLPALPTAPATLELTLSDGQRLRQTVTLEPWPVAETADTLPRLAAFRRLAGLPAEEATALAVQYQLVTPHTHFLMVDIRAEKAEDLPELRTVPHILAAGWGGTGRMAARSTARPIACDASVELDYLDIPAFFRRQASSDDSPRYSAPSAPSSPRPQRPEDAAVESPPPQRRASIVQRVQSFFFSRPDVLEEPPLPSTPVPRFAYWLEKNALRLADQPQPVPTLDELAQAGLPDEILIPLRELVAQGEAEAAVVAALLHAFLQHGPKCALPRKFTRPIRSHFQRQVSTMLAAAVEPLVKTWCTTG